MAEATGREAADLQKEFDSLQDELDRHRKAQFGPSSERRGRPDDEYLEKAAFRSIRNTNQRDLLPYEVAEN